MKIKSYIHCTNCGSSAVTLNKSTCISTKKFGRVCGGKIVKVKGLLINGVGFWRVKPKTI